MCFNKFKKLKGVGIKKDVLIKYIAGLDTDDNGIIELDEVAEALVYLWKKAKGKVKQPKNVIIGE